MNTTEALSNVIVTVPVIRIWSGQVSMRRGEDLAQVHGLPPKGLVSDGSKKIIDPKHLTPLESQRRCVNRDLAHLGIRTPMGYLIAHERENEVHDEMERRKQRFGDARDELIRNYDSLCMEWEAKNPGFETMLRRNRPQHGDVASACDFDYVIYKVGAVDSEVGQKQFQAVARTATTSLTEDIAATASAILRDSFEGRKAVTQRAVNVVRELVRKLKSFSMFDARIMPTAEALESLLVDTPLTGPLDQSQTLVISAMLRSMADPDVLLSLRNFDDDEQHAHDDEAEDEETLEFRPAPSQSAVPTIAENAPAVF